MLFSVKIAHTEYAEVYVEAPDEKTAEDVAHWVETCKGCCEWGNDVDQYTVKPLKEADPDTVDGTFEEMEKDIGQDKREAR